MQEKEMKETILDDVSANKTEKELNNRTQADAVNEAEETQEACTSADSCGEEAVEDASEEEKAEKKDKKLFGKKEKKDKKDEKIDELNDKLMRTMAEFDNFRKRTDKEKTQMFEIGAKDIVEKILPVIDNFERGLATVPEDSKDSAFTQGIEQIYKQLLTALGEAGVKPIDAVGKEFDPNFHNAVMHDEDENYGENIVSEELLKGYMYRETVVRHSMVKVVN